MSKKPEEKKKKRFDEDDLEALTEFLLDETPAVGTMRRVWERIRKRMTRDYVEQIADLTDRNEKLQEVIIQQSRTIDQLTDLVEKLEKDGDEGS